MAEITAEGHMSTTTTIIDGKNGSVPSSSMRVGKKSVTEDFVNTFSSPAAWLLVVALIVTWSAVAIVMFDLVDYKDLAGRSVHKLSTEPLRIIHETLEESSDWIYGFFSLLSDIVWSDDDDSDEGEVEPSLKKEIQKQKTERPEKRTPAKATQRDKPEKQEKTERKEPPKVTSKDKLERQEKPEKKERHAAVHKEKPEKPEKQEKKAPSKVTQKDAPERHEKTEKKPPPKEEKKVKSTKVEAKVKKEVKDGKGEAKTAEKVKQAETKTTETGLIKAKTKVKEEKALQTVTKSDKKDQYAFCRYVIDMFAQGDFYPGAAHKEFAPPRLLLEHSPRKKPAAIEEEKSVVVPREVKKRKEEKKKSDEKKTMTETKVKEKTGKKEKAHEKTSVPEIKKADKKEAAVSKELKKPAKAPAANPAIKKTAAPDPQKKEKIMESGKTTKKEAKVHAAVETPKSKAGLEKKEGKTTKAAVQDKPKMKQGNPGKDKELKSPAATKNKELAKVKEGKNPTSLREKVITGPSNVTKEARFSPPSLQKRADSLKVKNLKNPESIREKETGKRKDVKPPTALKEKDSSKRKEIKASNNPKEKAAVKKEGEKKATSENTHEHKHERVKREKAVSQSKPEEKMKQEKTAPTEKSAQAKPAKHVAIRHEKDVPLTKPVKPKNTAKPTAEIPTSATKKPNTIKEKEEKTTTKKQLKDEKAKVKEDPRHQNLTSGKDQVQTRLRNLKVYKSMGPDKILPWVLKELAEEVAMPLSNIFEKSWQSGGVPTALKKGNIMPIFKKGDKEEPGNDRSVSLPPVSGKIMEKLLLETLLRHKEHNEMTGNSQYGMTKVESCLTNFLASYDRVTAVVDEGRATGIISLDLNKGTVPQDIYVSKMERRGSDEWATGWIKNWLDDHAQSAEVSGAMSKWKAVPSGVPQGSVFGLVLFNIFIADMESGFQCTLSEFTNDSDDTQVCDAINTLEGRNNTQRDLVRLERWAQVILMKFNNAKCEVLHLVWRSPRNSFRLGREWKETRAGETDLGLPVHENLDMTQQCVLEVKKAVCILGCIKSSVASTSKEVILSLYSALVRPQLEYCVQDWEPEHEKDVDMLEQVEEGVINLSPGLEHISYEDRQREMGQFSLEKRRLRGYLITVFQYLQGACKRAKEGLFTTACSDRENGFKLKEVGFSLDIREKVFTVRVVRLWNRLPREVVDSPSLEVFKARLGRTLRYLV